MTMPEHCDPHPCRLPWGTAAAVVLAAFVLAGWVAVVIKTVEGCR